MFAEKFGLGTDEALSPSARQAWEEWKLAQDSGVERKGGEGTPGVNTDESHDTVGVISLDRNGHLAAATSTSGWPFKHPGRVGDSPLVGTALIIFVNFVF